MGSKLILLIKRTVIINTMLNVDGDFDGRWRLNVFNVWNVTRFN